MHKQSSMVLTWFAGSQGSETTPISPPSVRVRTDAWKRILACQFQAQRQTAREDFSD